MDLWPYVVMGVRTSGHTYLWAKGIHTYGRRAELTSIFSAGIFFLLLPVVRKDWRGFF